MCKDCLPDTLKVIAKEFVDQVGRRQWHVDCPYCGNIHVHPPQPGFQDPPCGDYEIDVDNDAGYCLRLKTPSTFPD